MQADGEGLRSRLRRIAGQVQDQHRHLSRFQEELWAAAAPVLADGASDACARYERALEGHFDLEETMFFPALHGYAPAQQSALQELADEHEVLRRELHQLARAIAEGAEGAVEHLRRFRAQLEAHEQRESALWDRVR